MKLLHTLLCFAILTFVSSQTAIIEVAPADARMTTMIVGGGTVAAGCTIPGTPDIEYSTNSADLTLANSNADGYRFISDGNDWCTGDGVPVTCCSGAGTGNCGNGGDLAKVCVYIADTGTDGTITVRIDDDSDLSTYFEEFGPSATISSNQWVCFDSVDNDTLAADTDYYIAVLKSTNSGLEWYTQQSTGPATGVAYVDSSGWTLGGQNTVLDHNFRIYYCD